MTSLKNEFIWELLNKYQFDIDHELLNDLTCTICEKILKNARQSLCGCRYCYECIKTYLNNDEKCCPGRTKDCVEQSIRLDKDIHLDHVANMKVSRLVVTCPESSCQFSDELRNMPVHIETHETNCPYFIVGCNEPGLNSLTMADHLHTDGIAHATLIIDSLQRLQNELTVVRDQSQQAASTSDTLTDQLDKIKAANGTHISLTQRLLVDIAELETAKDVAKENFINLNNELEIFKKNAKQKEVNEADSIGDGYNRCNGR